MKKYLIIFIIFFLNISQAESCNKSKLLQFLKPMITGDNRILPEQIKYLSGKKLKEFLYNNEITISHYNNKHSYFFGLIFSSITVKSILSISLIEALHILKKRGFLSSDLS